MPALHLYQYFLNFSECFIILFPCVSLPLNNKNHKPAANQSCPCIWCTFLLAWQCRYNISKNKQMKILRYLCKCGQISLWTHVPCMYIFSITKGQSLMSQCVQYPVSPFSIHAHRGYSLSQDATGANSHMAARN